MTLRNSIIAVGVAAIVAVGCESRQRATYTYDNTETSSPEANAQAAEAAEQEVAKQNAEEKAKTEKTAKAEKHGKDHKKDHGKDQKNSKVAKADKAEKGATEKAPKKERHPASQASAPKKNSVYIVQVGAFRVKENAEKLHTKLKSSGFPVIMREMNHSKNGLLYLVRMEPTPNRQEAETMLASLKTKSEFTGQIIVRPEGD